LKSLGIGLSIMLKGGWRPSYLPVLDLKLSICSREVGGQAIFCARSEAIAEIQARLPEVRMGNCDKLIWTGSKKGIYVSSDTV
jgi:hypothetical protein